jgi:microcystin-dependent protein
MTLSVKHAFQSAKGDGPDTTRLKPSNWNAEHLLVTDTPGIVLGRGAAAGPGPIQELPLSSLFPSGVILPYGGSTAPDANWLMCYGQLLSRTIEASLFAAIGTAFGAGDGVNTFAAPDGRGAALAGKTNMGGADKGNLAGGAVLGALLGAQASGPVGVGVGNYFSGGGFSAGGYTTGSQSVRVYGNTTTEGGGLGTVGGGPATGPHSHFYDGTYNTNGENLSVVINSFGASGGTNSFYIVQPTLIVNYIIKR